MKRIEGWAWVGLLAGLAGKLAAAEPQRAARVEVTLVQTAAEAPPLGCNGFGDPGGTAFSAGNLIPDSGFEPMSIRKRYRVDEAGIENGHPWFTVSADGGMSGWELTASGYLSGADMRVYRIVDEQGQVLPQTVDGYLDLARAVEYRRVGTSRVVAAGAQGFPLGGWVDTVYAQPGPIVGTRANLDFTDAAWIENGKTYYYIVTAIGRSSAEAGGGNESDWAESVELSATPQDGLPGGPWITVAAGDAFNEIGRARSNEWFSFSPGVAGAEGAATWELLDAEDGPLSPPDGLVFDSATGSISGTPTATPGATLLRLRVTASNGVATRDFILNNPDWAVVAGDPRPPAPTNGMATAGDGFVHLSWSPSAGANVVGYRVYRSEYPRQAQRQRVYLETNAPALAKDDYVHLNKRILRADPNWAHPRVRTGGVGESWRDPNAGGIGLERVAHEGSLPEEFRFPGDSCLRVTVPGSGEQRIEGPYIFYPRNSIGESEWYDQLEPGRRYRYEAWMRQSGLGNGGWVALTFGGMYAGIEREFAVNGEWRLHGFEFIAPERPTEGSHDCPAIRTTGPGTLWVDNVRLFRADTEEDVSAVLTPPSPLVFDELMTSQPAHGEKGMLRHQEILLHKGTMASALGMHRDAGLVMNWYQSAAGAPNMTVPYFLQYAYLTGDSPGTRMKPWFNVSSHMSEEEWGMLVEYLGAPIDPGDPADVEAKPWAYLRYQQRGKATSWTEEFSRIYFEFANETWHNGAVSDEWFGWARAGWVHEGAVEFGLVADHFTSHVRDHSPYFGALDASGKLRFVLGSNYRNYGEIAAARAPGGHAVAHTSYVGPKWEVGEEPFATYDAHGIQATLLGYVADTERLYRDFRRWREELAAEGPVRDLLGYEGGPSGYALPGQDASADAHEYSERYGKSIAMAVAALDVWLGAHEYGFADQAYLGFGPGDYWSSHTAMNHGYRPHAGWLALTLRNRMAEGRMIRSAVVESPTINWDGEEIPLVSSYAFRAGRRLHVFLLSRKLGGVHDGVDWGEGSTAVTLALPANPAGTATLYRISGDPRDTNRNGMEVEIEAVATNLARETTIALPEGSIYLYVVETDLPDRDDPLPPPPGITGVVHSATGTALSWPAVAGAEGYVVFRSPQPFFDRRDVRGTFFATNATFLDEEGVGGTRYYYRVAATNGWGVGFWTLVAAGGTNAAAPVVGRPHLHGLMEAPEMLVATWDPVGGATGYRVGISRQSGGPYEWSEAGIATSWSFAGLENGKAYYVVVHAGSASGRGPESQERAGTPLAPGAPGVLAAWEGSVLTYGNTNDLPESMPVARQMMGVAAGEVALGPDMECHFDDYGFGIGTGEGEGATYYDGKLVFGPRDDGCDFGAEGGGSLSNAVERGIYVGFSLVPAAGQALSIQRIETGFQYPFGGRTLRVALRYRVGTGEWHTVMSAGYGMVPGAAEHNDLTLELGEESALQGVMQPLEMRFYFYAESDNARWHPAAMVRTAGEDLVVRGTCETVGVPGAPSGLNALGGEGGVMLSWVPVAGASSYTVHWGVGIGEWSGVMTGLVQAAATVTGLIDGLHWFAVEPVNGWGAGPVSAPLRVLVGPAPALALSGSSATGMVLQISRYLADSMVEGTSNLLSSAGWEPVAGAWSTNGTLREVSIRLDRASGFYRLSLP